MCKIEVIAEYLKCYIKVIKVEYKNKLLIYHPSAQFNTGGGVVTLCSSVTQYIFY
jgi:hypothetical protein